MAIASRSDPVRYDFSNFTYHGPGVFADPQPESPLASGLSQYDGQTDVIGLLLKTTATLSIFDWIPYFLLSRRKDNPVWANGWRARVIILAHAPGSPLQLSVAIYCQILASSLARNWVQAPGFREYMEHITEQYPRRPDLDPKLVEIDPWLSLIQFVTLISVIEAATRWAKLLMLRVFPTTWRLRAHQVPGYQHVAGNEGTYESEALDPNQSGPLARLLLKQQNRRMSIEHVINYGSVTDVERSQVPKSQANQGCPSHLRNSPIGTTAFYQRNLTIPRQHRALFFYAFVGTGDWGLTVILQTVQLMLNSVHRAFTQRPERTCKL